MDPIKLSIIIGSTRPNRFSETPAHWIFEEAKKREGFEVELLDLRDYPMPFYDLPMSPSRITDGNYPNEVVNKWAKKIGASDAFIMVTPEYNHGYSAVLKNALDSCYHEWNNKAVGFVAYGSAAGARSVEQLRLVSVELQMAPVRTAVHIPWSIVGPVAAGEKEFPKEDPSLTGPADTLLTQLLLWGRALKNVRKE